MVTYYYYLNKYKAASILFCLAIACFYLRSPQNVFQPVEEQQLSRYEYLKQPSVNTTNIEYLEKNVVTAGNPGIKRPSSVSNHTTNIEYLEKNVVTGGNPGIIRPSSVSNQSSNIKQKQIKAVDYKFKVITNQKNKNDSDVLEQEFNFRQDLLQKGCVELGAQADQLNIDWDNGAQVRYVYLDKRHNARVCKNYKSGYSSWRATATMLRKLKRKGNGKALLLTVRHPLIRLLSAWKDKYLGGCQLFNFDESWRQETNTNENWVQRWNRYWMLALVSTGKIEAPESLKEAMKKNKKIEAAIKKVTLQKGSTIKLPGMVDMNEFRNISFTFEDFLRHVIWTYDNGVPNIHWTPTIVQCNVCNLKFDYILHLENSTQEVPHVLSNLGFDIKEFAMPTVHQSHKTKENKSVPKDKQKVYIDYYNNVSKDVVDRIMKLYDADFNLFGYPKEFM